MDEGYLRKFDWFILKPTDLVLLVLCGWLLWRGDWWTGAAIGVLSLFGVGFVAGELHREKSFQQLAAGYPTRQTLQETPSTELDNETAYRLSQAIFRLAVVLAIVAGLLSYRFGLRWYFVVGIAVAVGWLSLPLFGVATAIIVRPRKSR